MSELKVIESELVPVYETDKGERVVYGTELHGVLEVKSRFNDWIKNRLDDCDAEENKDFQTFTKILVKGGRPQTEYIIQLATAKEMAMLERNDKGKQVRRYFIAVEEKFKEVVQAGAIHNVKQLTITSRDIATMLSDRKKHAFVLNEIRGCIVELEEMGFDVSEFFIESTYRGGNNQDGRPQYLCTERGCERFSWRLEPEERRVFLQEFMDRFDRMKGVLDGKPVKRAQIDEDKETVIRIFRNNNWGILLMDNEVYNMTPEEIDMISRFVPEMQKRGIDRVKKVLCAFMDSMSRGGKLEEIASWGVKEEEPVRPLLVDKVEQKSRTRLQTDSSVSLSSIEILTELQAKTRYNVGRNKLLEIADKAGAVIKVSERKKGYSREVLDDYFRRRTE